VVEAASSQDHSLGRTDSAIGSEWLRYSVTAVRSAVAPLKEVLGPLWCEETKISRRKHTRVLPLFYSIAVIGERESETSQNA